MDKVPHPVPLDYAEGQTPKNGPRDVPPRISTQGILSRSFIYRLNLAFGGSIRLVVAI